MSIYLREDGIYARFYSEANVFNGSPALFIDRDGVLVEEANYLGRVEDVAFIQGSPEAVSIFNAARVPVVVVTNQSGIGRGYFGWDEFEVVQDFIVSSLASRGGRLDAVIACPYHEEGQGKYREANHPYRKPNPGMMLLAGSVMGLDIARSWMVGDKVSDMAAATAAGLAGAVHVVTGHGEKDRGSLGAAAAKGMKGTELILADSFIDAVPVLMEKMDIRI